MTRKIYNAEGYNVVGPYSHAVDAGEFVFLSGQTPLDPATGKLAEGGVDAQTEQVLVNLTNVLKAAGLTTDNVIKVNVFLTDMATFSDMNSVYTKYFTAPYPARSTIGVASLPLGAQVEIELIARK